MSLAPAICPRCRDWAPGETDRFCGGCGAFIAPIRFDWSLQGKGSSAKLALKASVLSEWSAEDRADFADLRLTVANEAQDVVRRGSTFDLARLVSAAGVPLMDETRAMRGGTAQVLVLRALAGRAGKGDAFAGDGLLALVDAMPAPVIGLAQSTLLIPDLIGVDTPQVRLTNDGGPIAVHGVRMVLDNVFDANAGWEMLPGPIVLETGDSAAVPLRLSEAQIAALKQPEGLHEGEVEIIDGLGVAISAGRVTLIMPLDADARVEVANYGMGLTGRRARLAVRLNNTGGHPLVVEDIRIELTLDKTSATATLPVPICWASPLDRGDAAPVELRPWLTKDGTQEGKGLAAGLYDLNVQLRCRSGETLVERQAHGTWRVRDPAPLEGRICIDFGTTESAAALAPGRLARLNEGEALKPPLIIELGRVGIPADGEGFGDRFLPTVVFRSGGGDLRFGDEALLMEVDQRHGDQLLTNFKWRLEDGDGAQAATQYLAHVRCLIEEHPQVAALITDKTEIYATRPVDFAEGQAEALAKAFRDAGFREPRTNIFAKREEPTLIYESWSPMIMALFEEPWLFTPLDREVILREGFVLPGQVGQTGYVAVFDIGGGSADLSVLKVDEETGVRRILEVYKRTDLEFVGLKFAELIKRELVAWLREKGGAPSEAVADESVWQDAVQSIQHAPGLLSDGSLETPMRDYFRVCLDDGDGTQEMVRNLCGRLGVPFDGEPRQAKITEAQAALRARMMPYLRRLRLPLAGGGRRAVTVADLPQLLGRVVAAFAVRYVRRVSALVDDLVDTSGLSGLREASETDSAQLARLIQSGRGAAFPLADHLVFTLFGALREKGLQAVRLPPLSAKSITSYGGLYLADHASMDWDVSFNLGREVRRFWLGVGISTRPGSRGPVRLAFPRLEDGSAACLNCADIPERFRFGPWRVDSSWEGSTKYDDCGEVPVPAGFAEDPKAWWLVARRRDGAEHVASVKAATAEEAAAQTLAESMA